MPNGDYIEGTFTGPWGDGIRINGTFHKLEAGGSANKTTRSLQRTTIIQIFFSIIIKIKIIINEWYEWDTATPRLRLNINLPVILRLGFRVRKATQFEWGWPSQYLAKLEYFRILIFYSVSYRKRLGEEDNWKRKAHIQAELSLSLRLLSFLFPFSDQSTLTSRK